MPAVGKSTIGVLLAKRSRRNFLDTDLFIQRSEKRSLRRIIFEQGIKAFRAIEERHILSIDTRDTVISTGGSVIYSERSMEHLRRQGWIVFLDSELAEIEERVGDVNQRGVVRRPEQSLAELYNERRPLYQCYADLTVDCTGRTQEQVTTVILERLPTELL